MGERLTDLQEPRGLYQARATVDKLPDEVLLDIFAVYDDDQDRIQSVDKWHTLVHVCRRWRDLVFASPRSLNLRLRCRGRTRVRAMLDIWPALPIEINDPWIGMWQEGLDNIVAALEHPDRVRSIALRLFSSSAWGTLVAAMQVPFPELTYLWLWSGDGSTLVLPNSFLGGSAPRLRTLKLGHISFPAVSNLLSSASDLVHLSLRRLPHSGYISPASMVACLSSLNRLESLLLGFESHQSSPDQPGPPPQTRVVLPALTDLTFEGMTDYFDDFLSRIDAPVLNKFSITFFMDPVFDVPHFEQFIGRAKGLKPYKVARVAFTADTIELSLMEPLPLSLEIICGNRIVWKVGAMSLVCRQLSLFLSLVERLDIAGDLHFKSRGEDALDFSRIFRPFSAIRSLHVSESLMPLVASALQEFIGPRATEVLPNLRDLFLGGSAVPGTVPEAMRPFVDARRLSGQPIAIHHWEGPGVDL